MYIAILCSWLFCAVKNCLNLIDCILSRNESGRVVKGLSFGLKSFTLRLNDFVLDCLSTTSWLLFVCSQLVCFQPIEILNSSFTCPVYWKFLSVNKKSHFVKCPLLNPIMQDFPGIEIAVKIQSEATHAIVTSSEKWKAASFLHWYAVDWPRKQATSRNMYKNAPTSYHSNYKVKASAKNFTWCGFLCLCPSARNRRQQLADSLTVAGVSPYKLSWKCQYHLTRIR